MEQTRSSQFLLGLKRYGAVAGAAILTAAAPFNTSAHVHSDNPVSRSLMGYEGFVNRMSQMNADGTPMYMGSCCHLKDGVGNIKEERVTEGKKTVYYVTFTHDTDGTLLDKPTRVRVPDKAVLTDRFAIKFCENFRADVAAKIKNGEAVDPEEKKQADTCIRPPTNISWIGGFERDINGKIRKDEQGNAILMDWKFYCYIPVPRNQ